MHECEICGGPVGLLGVLGNTGHYLCRNCGMAFTGPAPEPDEIDDGYEDILYSEEYE